MSSGKSVNRVPAQSRPKPEPRSAQLGPQRSQEKWRLKGLAGPASPWPTAATGTLCDFRQVPFPLWASVVPPPGGAAQARASGLGDGVQPLPWPSTLPAELPRLGRRIPTSRPRLLCAPPSQQVRWGKPGSPHGGRGSKGGVGSGWRRPQTEGDY